MRRHALNLGLGLALGASLAANVLLRRPAERPNWEFAPAMARSARYDAFEPNHVFADEATLRSPVAGTIPRGLPPLRYEPTRAGAARAGAELVNPFSIDDREAVARGARLYADFCTPCHGHDGQGHGPVVERGFRRPPNLLRPFTVRMPDGQYFHILTFGQGRMASYAAELARDDRWKVILHMRRLQQAGRAGRASSQDAAAGQAAVAQGFSPAGQEPVAQGFSPARTP